VCEGAFERPRQKLRVQNSRGGSPGSRVQGRPQARCTALESPINRPTSVHCDSPAMSYPLDFLDTAPSLAAHSPKAVVTTSTMPHSTMPPPMIVVHFSLPPPSNPSAFTRVAGVGTPILPTNLPPKQQHLLAQGHIHKSTYTNELLIAPSWGVKLTFCLNQ
jgi:hypothetical protein